MAIDRKRNIKKVTIVEDTKTVTKTAVELTDSEKEILEKFLKARSEETEARKEKDRLSALLKESLGDAQVALVDGEVRAEILRYPRVTIDSKLLFDSFPEAYDATSRETIVTRIQAK
jgi:predicted phage-related endonuclease